MMADVIISVVIVAVVAAAIVYIVRAKRRGVKCIGCPSQCNCSKQSNDAHSCGCSCGCAGDEH